MNYNDCINAVVNIHEDYYNLLLLLYPNLSFVDMGSKHSNFISIHDVKSKIERINLGSQYTNYLVISNRIFDFEILPNDLINLVLQFRRRFYKSRKRSLQIDPQSPSFVDDLYHYLTLGELVEDDQSVVELFSLVGSRSFEEAYLKVCETTPTPKVNRAIITFLTKVQTGSETLFYKKARARLYRRLEQNLSTALKETNRISRSEYELQLNFISAHKILFEC